MVDLLALIDSFADLDRLVNVGIDDERHLVGRRLLPVRVDADLGVVCVHVDVPIAGLDNVSALLNDLLDLLLGPASAVRHAVDDDLRREQARASPALGVGALPGVVGEAREGVLPARVVEEGDGIRQEEHVGVCRGGVDAGQGRRARLARLRLEELRHGERLEVDEASIRVNMVRVLANGVSVGIQVDGTDQRGLLLPSEESAEDGSHCAVETKRVVVSPVDGDDDVDW